MSEEWVLVVLIEPVPESLNTSSPSFSVVFLEFGGTGGGSIFSDVKSFTLERCTMAIPE